jgi:hypothetical protein
MADRAESPIQDPQAQLERAFIDEFLRERGCDLSTVNRRPSDERKSLMTGASRYAATKLAEIDARAAYVHDLHGSRE